MTTLQQVATRAGCSLATASRALSRNGNVSDRMARRVRRAAAELGYRPIHSSAGRPGQRPVVGVLIPSITNPVFASSLSSIQNRMLVAGHGVLIAQSNYDPAREADAVASLLNDRPTGLILTVCDPATSVALMPSLPPTVLLHNMPTALFPAAVTVDNRGAGHELTTLLIGLGHRRILFVSGAFATSDRARFRHEGYRDAMAESGIPPLEAVQIPFVSGYDQLDLSAELSMFSPTAIIASNDLLAFGVIGALRREGLSVPRDISVAGFDGIAIGRLMDPPLTTVEMPDASMGAAAASLLLDMAENAAPARHLDVAYMLRRGGTVRAI
ncbi:substrate-binding domain-containing protein [Neorhizobium galegae]|uniref:substrate-binding domain-containing protein n=1 Tax=Neorhizobium galegae TaxID=399 RepID=UPI00062121B0|nr:substrate-binding domain-containing protein [Neorhizobium galegae]CDZ27876.1 Transcriptional repressor, LacI family [Neorhizobium galegae bv. officinalis]KAA9382940.1 LacI family DNA-binding transcriptional regulator [Neorhizobium galegae]MCM2498901.1 substrate-binding domain-containing protein [Neorhizobium galegae]MCQ1766904.1 substrate-binding domain-containing protein [Neorhizobium galegae]MCQ1849129.1 substrate-binding domain-containing protein [Neorhizobium galegae]